MYAHAIALRVSHRSAGAASECRVESHDRKRRCPLPELSECRRRLALSAAKGRRRRFGHGLCAGFAGRGPAGKDRRFGRLPECRPTLPAGPAECRRRIQLCRAGAGKRPGTQRRGHRGARTAGQWPRRSRGRKTQGRAGLCAIHCCRAAAARRLDEHVCLLLGQPGPGRSARFGSPLVPDGQHAADRGAASGRIVVRPGRIGIRERRGLPDARAAALARGK